LRQGAEKVNQGKRAPPPPSNPIAGANEDQEDPALKVWMVTFRNMKNVILTCDLEVRSKYVLKNFGHSLISSCSLNNRALADLFEVLNQNGHQFNPTFWKVILSEIILPLFDRLSGEPGDAAQQQTFSDDVTVWISTTLVNALKLFVELYTNFPLLTSIAINPLLDLLMKCILQENDTLAKLGSSCIVDYIEHNCAVFTESDWDNICGRLVKLFEITRPTELFFEADYEPGQTAVPHPLGLPFAPKPERKQYPKIIVKCVLHLLVIQTIHKILGCSKRDSIYGSLHQKHVFQLGDALYQSYIFAKVFNEHMVLRHTLHQIGFMKQIPNLVKQETSAVACYIILLSHIYSDKSPQQALISKEVERRLLP
jgi:brefeldin A-inhibited guanine nucleotide-exchange protein